MEQAYTVVIDDVLCTRLPVHIGTIRPGDTVEIDGHLKTVCVKDLKRCPDMGVTLFGDSYRLGTVPVIKATPVTAKRVYKGYEIVKTGRQAWDYRVCFSGRTRWGTLDEVKADIDSVVSGIGLPSPQRGFA